MSSRDYVEALRMPFMRKKSVPHWSPRDLIGKVSSQAVFDELIRMVYVGDLRLGESISLRPKRQHPSSAPTSSTECRRCPAT